VQSLLDHTIDEVNRDTLIDAHGVVDTSHARSVVDSRRTYVAEHRAEITAIQLLAEAGDPSWGTTSGGPTLRCTAIMTTVPSQPATVVRQVLSPDP